MNEKTESAGGDQPAQNLVDDARELLKATADVTEDKVKEARRRLTAALEKGKDAWHAVQETAVSSAKATDKAIREHPYPSLAVAFGVGILIGLLARRRD